MAALSRQPWILACVAVAALSACATGRTGADGYVLPKGESLAELRQQAREALVRYDRAVAEAGGSKTVTVTPSAWNPTAPPPGMAFDAATVTPAGTRMSVTFVGTPGPAAEPCGMDYIAEAVESDNAVVVILIAQHHADSEICTLIGQSRTATVNLARPLNNRAVLEVRQGQPVPVSTGPVPQ